MAIIIKISRVHSHAGLGRTIRIDRAAGQHRHVLESTIMLVDPQLLGPFRRCNVDIHPTVFVEIRADNAQRPVESAADLRLGGDILKCPVMPVTEEVVGQGS